MSDGTKEPLVTPAVKSYWVHVIEPQAGTDGFPPRYSITMGFDKVEHADFLERLKGACRAAANSRWPRGLPAGLKSPIKDGDRSARGRYFEGQYWIRASAKYEFPVVDGEGVALTDPVEAPDFGIYSAVLVPHAWSFGEKAGVCLQPAKVVRVALPEAGGASARAVAGGGIGAEKAQPNISRPSAG